MEYYIFINFSPQAGVMKPFQISMSFERVFSLFSHFDEFMQGQRNIYVCMCIKRQKGRQAVGVERPTDSLTCLNILLRETLARLKGTEKASAKLN